MLPLLRGSALAGGGGRGRAGPSAELPAERALRPGGAPRGLYATPQPPVTAGSGRRRGAQRGVGEGRPASRACGGRPACGLRRSGPGAQGVGSFQNISDAGTRIRDVHRGFSRPPRSESPRPGLRLSPGRIKTFPQVAPQEESPGNGQTVAIRPGVAVGGTRPPPQPGLATTCPPGLAGGALRSRVGPAALASPLPRGRSRRFRKHFLRKAAAGLAFLPEAERL